MGNKVAIFLMDTLIKASFIIFFYTIFSFMGTMCR